MFEKWLDLLSDCMLFKGIPFGQLGGMLSCIEPKVKSYTRNEFISIEGERFNGIGLVLSGNAAVTRENAAGERVIMSVLEPGELFGEMAAFLDSKTWPATVVAQNKCSIMFLPPGKIVGQCEKVCDSHRMLALNMLRILSRKAAALNRKVEYLAMGSLRSKIAAFLLEQAKNAGTTTFLLQMKRNELADYLNASRPSLSREMGRMRDEGVLEFHRSSIRIRDMGRLREMTE